MSVLYIVLPVSLLLAAGFVAAFVWAVRCAQYDDVETPALRMLSDDVPLTPEKRDRNAQAPPREQ